jgi:predicted ATPase/transcriptional regulator with XRE-family HTH domain
MEEAAFFGDWLRLRRESLGLTRPEVAGCVGCSVSALRKIEADERRPSPQLAELLAACLQIPEAERQDFIRAARGAVRVERLGQPEAAQLARASSPPGWRLPAPTTALVGRKAELATLARLVNDPACRLLTLVGPGGIGKSRLALEVACNEWARFAGGAYFVPLAALSSAEFLAPAIAHALGYTFSGTAAPIVQLTRFLRDKEILLLLDNLEHLLDGAGLLAELMEQAPGLTLLATSRERLELQGEWVFEVEGLPVPASSEQESSESYSAIQLFEHRARQALLSFAITAANRADVVRICRLLGGMPLAIELAATWVPVLSCAEIVAEIERGLDILATTRRDALGRQRSLRAVFDHSWGLLAEDERRTARALAIFRGGCNREAAAAVAGANLPMLSSLAAKSFLRRTAAGRYHQHELVRQYCLGRLLEAPDEDQRVRERHGMYFTALVARLEPDLKGDRQGEAMAAIDADIDNIRLASRWAVNHGRLDAMVQSARSFWVYYDISGRFQEAADGFGWAAGQLEREPEEQEERTLAAAIAAAYARAQQAWFSLRLGRFDEAQRLLPPALQTLRAAAAWRELIDALHHAGALARLMGDYAGSRAYFEEMLQLAQLMEDGWNVTLADGNIGLAAAAMGDYVEGRARMTRTVGDYRELADQRMLGISLHFLGEVHCESEAYEEARRCEEESLAISQGAGDRWLYSMSLRVLGRIALETGEGARAVEHFRECVRAARAIQEQWTLLQGLNGLGSALLSVGAVGEAQRAFGEALEQAWQTQAIPDVLVALLGLAQVLVRGEPASRSDLQSALLPVLVVMGHPASSQHSREEARRLWETLQASLPAEQIQAAQANAAQVPLGALVARMMAPPVAPEMLLP